METLPTKSELNKLTLKKLIETYPILQTVQLENPKLTKAEAIALLTKDVTEVLVPYKLNGINEKSLNDLSTPVSLDSEIKYVLSQSGNVFKSYTTKTKNCFSNFGSIKKAINEGCYLLAPSEEKTVKMEVFYKDLYFCFEFLPLKFASNLSKLITLAVRGAVNDKVAQKTLRDFIEKQLIKNNVIAVFKLLTLTEDSDKNKTQLLLFNRNLARQINELANNLQINQ